MKSKYLLIVCAWMFAICAHAGTYTEHSAFSAVLDKTVVDKYDDPAYGSNPVNILSDAAMSSVLGETHYQTTTFPELNLVTIGAHGERFYCGGCNGGFTLDFGATSVGSTNGVFGVGFDIYYSSGTSASVTYGDGSTSSISLNNGWGGYQGFTSDLLIKSISFSVSDSFAISSLTIGSMLPVSPVPEPDAYAMLFAGLGLIGAVVRRRRKRA